jgi:galactokinase
VLAAADLSGTDLPAERLVGICVQAENDFAGAPTGGMDQAIALLAVAGHALLLDSRTWAAEPVPLPWSEPGAQQQLVVIDSSARHALVDGQYADRRTRCEAAAATLGVTHLADLRPASLPDALPSVGEDAPLVRHVVTEAARVRAVVACLRAGQHDAVGPLLTASHLSLRDDFRVSCPELDLLVDAAVSGGALGARMTGGGFGGSAVVLVRAGGLETVLDAVSAAFADAGFAAPRAVPAKPSGAATKVI